MSINWQLFGSNGQEKADYSRGVLERFPNRAKEGCDHVKTIMSPRKIDFMSVSHNAIYFPDNYAVNENGDVVAMHVNDPATIEKIAVNHYHVKSLEEYLRRNERGDVYYLNPAKRTREYFDSLHLDEVFDDGILKYRDERAKIYQSPDKSRVNERLLTALMKNLLPTLKPDTPQDFYAGKMETFLTCRAVASYLKTKLTDAEPAKFFEEASLNAILRAFNGMTFADSRMLIRELPELLRLPYPIVNDLRNNALNLTSQMLNIMHFNGMWKDFVELNYLQEFLKE